MNMEGLEIGEYKPEQGKYLKKLSLVDGYLKKVKKMLLEKAKAHYAELIKPLTSIDPALRKRAIQQSYFARMVYLELLMDQDDFPRAILERFQDDPDYLKHAEVCRIALANYFTFEYWNEISSTRQGNG